MKFQRGDKVIFKNQLHYFGWYTGNGENCTIFENENDSGMQDTYAVPIRNVFPYEENSCKLFLTEDNLRELRNKHQNGSYPTLQNVILKLIDAIADDKGWNL